MKNNMKKIEDKYIKFAIKNWRWRWKKGNFIEVKKNTCGILTCRFELNNWLNTAYFISFTDVITSHLFLEAIAKGFEKKLKWDKEKELYYIWPKASKEKIWYSVEQIEDEITYNQAMAIRDDSMEEFITNLWIWGKVQKC